MTTTSYRQTLEERNRLTGPQYDGARFASFAPPMLCIDLQPGGHKDDHERTYLRPAVGFTTAAIRIHEPHEIRQLLVAGARALAPGSLRDAAAVLQGIALDLME